MAFVFAMFGEVSHLSSMGHFKDLGQENTSVCAPFPKTYLEKHRPLAASDGGAARRGAATNLRPRQTPLTSHTLARAGIT